MPQKLPVFSKLANTYKFLATIYSISDSKVIWQRRQLTLLDSPPQMQQQDYMLHIVLEDPCTRSAGSSDDPLSHWRPLTVSIFPHPATVAIASF